MWNYKYGTFADEQEKITKDYMRKQIYFLLLYVDNETKGDYEGVDVSMAFENVLTWFGGLNEVLFHPAALVRVIALLEAAKIEFESEHFDFKKYRKLILDAGAEVLKIQEVE